MWETLMTTRQEPLEELSLFGIKEPQIHLRGRRSSIFKEGIEHGDTIFAKRRCG